MYNLLLQGGKTMKKHTILIIPGYIAGLGSLWLITYRTLLAFFSESKTVTVYINAFGEQYADLVSLIIIWGICILSAVALYKIVKQEEDKPLFHNITGKKVVNRDGLYLGNLRHLSFDEKTGIVSRIFVEPSKYVDPNAHTFDETGNIILPFDSVELTENVIIQK